MKSRNRWHSFQAALTGAVHTVRSEPNARIELAAGIVAAAVGVWLRITPVEWAILAVTISTVLALEAVNSALESVVDLASPDIHELARIAKDCAGGALIFAVLGSLGVAAAIFGPRLLALVR